MDYEAIKKDNVARYGTDIGRIGPMLLADRYDDRTHFIFELLQNAEDALARRHGWHGSREVSFALTATTLRVSHFGMPFTEKDVRGICGIGESTKDLTSIGRFGIGFKSVYAFTGCPEIHSGDEHFAIESFVWPTAISAIDRKHDETIFILPLPVGDSTAAAEITAGLQRLGPRILLFLREIEEISWSVEGGPSGHYLRSSTGDNARKIVLIGQEHGKANVMEETWLVFSSKVRASEGVSAGYVEIAFACENSEDTDVLSVRPIDNSPLVVFFPTILPTHLGFLVQGPYRTTPSRDNVPRSDSWNQYLVRETAMLLIDALRTLRGQGMLDANALRSLPLDRAKFGKGSMFAPLFEAVCGALTSEPLLPSVGGGHAPASNAKLARTQELRELIGPKQLASLFGSGAELAWLSSDITQDRTPELRQYLIRELDIAEVTPEMILLKLDKAFLDAQPDDWILSLYEFLNGQPALLRRLDDVPLVRLEDGTHVTAMKNGQPQAFLPSTIETGFPTVRRAVCVTDETRKLLQSLGLTEPDPVDDVVRNVLPKYRVDEVDVSDADYEADIRRILTAFATDSKGQREKLLTALRKTAFVMVVDVGDGSKLVSRPDKVYLATERLKELFSGVTNVLLVDDSYACLRGEDIRDLLEASGASRYLRPVRVEVDWERRWQLRELAEATGTRSEEHIEDHSLHGLGLLLSTLPKLAVSQQRRKAELLWEALSDLEQRQRGVFTGTYSGQYYGPRYYEFAPDFVEFLRATTWVPDANDELQQPKFVVFDTLGWKPNPFLLSKIRFKPPIIETLAKEVGIEPGALDLLKKLGITSKAELLSRLGIEEQSETPGAGGPSDVEGAIEQLPGDEPEPTPPVPDPSGPEPSEPGNDGHGDSGTGGGTSSRGTGSSGAGTTGGDRKGGQSAGGREGDGKRTPGSASGQPFISYVGVHPHEEEQDPDGLDHQARMALEERAIALILTQEPQLRRTPANNPGYDLFEANDDGQPLRWIEVKAMTGTLGSRPVGLSRTQFDTARMCGTAYWLYIVEMIGAPEKARIIRIQNPAGRAQTFTFDHGWASVAATEDPSTFRKGIA